MATKKKTTKAAAAKVEEKKAATPVEKNEPATTEKNVEEKQAEETKPEQNETTEKKPSEESKNSVDVNSLSDTESPSDKANDSDNSKSTADKDSGSEEQNKNTGVFDYKRAEEVMNEGGYVALPEWGGFWFKDKDSDKTLVLTREGQVLDTHHDHYKERKDWQVVKPFQNQAQIIEQYYIDNTPQQEESPFNSKAVLYNRKFDGDFKKLEKTLSLEQLKQREDLPVDVSLRDSEFVFEDGSVYNIGKQEFTERDGKSILENYK